MSLSTALIAVGVLLAVAVGAGILWRVLDGRRRGGKGRRIPLADLSISGFAPVATLVLFSTETCARCPHVRRMLREIADASDGVQQVDVDLTHRVDLASRHGILQTPTTFIVGSDGAVLARFAGVPRRADIEDALPSSAPVLEPR